MTLPLSYFKNKPDLRDYLKSKNQGDGKPSIVTITIDESSTHDSNILGVLRNGLEGKKTN